MGGAQASYASSGPARSLQVELQGPYAAIKRWLGQAVSQQAQALALLSLELRPVGAAEEGGQAPLVFRLQGTGLKTAIQVRVGGRSQQVWWTVLATGPQFDRDA